MACGIKESVKTYCSSVYQTLFFRPVTLFYSHGRENLNMLEDRCSVSENFLSNDILRKKKTGNILLRSLRSVERSYFLLIKKNIFPPFNCFYKVVSNDICNAIKIKAE